MSFYHDAAMESYGGSFDLVPPDDVAPEPVPEQCSPCGSADPRWWYRVEAVPDEQGRVSGVRALARWWAVCIECHHLIAEGSVQSLIERIANRTRPACLGYRVGVREAAQRWGHVGPSR